MQKIIGVILIIVAIALFQPGNFMFYFVGGGGMLLLVGKDVFGETKELEETERQD